MYAYPRLDRQICLYWIGKDIWSYKEFSPIKVSFVTKLDGVGPVDNRPSTDKPHHFVRKNK